MAEVQWFLLDLFFLGYVEDPSSGLSFKIPSELNWECYFEVKIRSMILQTCAVSPPPLSIVSVFGMHIRTYIEVEYCSTYVGSCLSTVLLQLFP